MIPQDIIRCKRDGGTLSATQIEDFIGGLVSGAVSEGQAAAFAMAIVFRGMIARETAALTTAMSESGLRLSWSLNGPVLDKHSTGGVGDHISLILAPAVAACGGFVPMISGRGLGHTGGTLDKLDSIVGYETQPSTDLFQSVVRDIGCAIIGQTSDLAPADRKLYAIRDVTATVESIPLITASILSKKLAAGLDGLVMDVKTGSGAFMPTLPEAQALAQSLATVAREAGLVTTSVLTDMDQPLASSAGNALEVLHAIAHLRGEACEPRVQEVVVELGAQMLLLGRLAPNLTSARSKIEAALTSGAAAERFAQMVVALGGPADLMERAQQILPTAPVMMPVPASRSAYVAGFNTRALGMVVVALGGGRMRPQDKIDHAVGLSKCVEAGTFVHKGDPLCFVHARSMSQAQEACVTLQSAITLGDEASAPTQMVKQIFAA